MYVEVFWSSSDILYTFQTKNISELSFLELQQQERFDNFTNPMILLCSVMLSGFSSFWSDSFSGSPEMFAFMLYLDQNFKFPQYFLEK